MTENEIFKSIRKYITAELLESDIDFFSVDSLETLGQLFYNNILENVTNATENLIDVVIEKTSKDSLGLPETSYRIKITKYLGFTEIPSVVFFQFVSKYDELITGKWKNIKNRYAKLIRNLTKIENSLDREKKNLAQQFVGYSINTDFLSIKNEFNDIEKKLSLIRMRKESLIFSYRFVKGEMYSIIDENNSEKVTNNLKKLYINFLKFRLEPLNELENRYLHYSNYLDILDDELARPYMPFFKIKIITFRSPFFINHSLNQVPSIDKLHLLKRKQGDEYLSVLHSQIEKLDYIRHLKNVIEKCKTIKKRKDILLKCISMYEKGDYLMLNCVLPSQIEGIFSDFHSESTLMSEFYTNDTTTFRKKITEINNSSNLVYPEIVQYFQCYFNHMVRNQVAHGNYVGDSTCDVDNIFSIELLLDLFALVEMVYNTGEIDLMFRYIFSARRCNFCSNQDHYKYILTSFLEGSFNVSIRKAYWIFNPYFEQKYYDITMDSALKDIRATVLSSDFWEYVNNQISTITNCSEEVENVLQLIEVINNLDIPSQTNPILKKLKINISSLLQDCNDTQV